MNQEFAFLTAGLSIEGRRRDQDDLFWLSDNGRILVMSDGLSAYTGGGIAAWLAVQAAIKLNRFAPGSTSELAEQSGMTRLWCADFEAKLCRYWFEDVHTQARDWIREMRVRNSHMGSMGAAVLYALRLENRLHVAHLGDIKAFRIRDGKRELLNTANHVRIRNFLSRYVGNVGRDQFDFVDVELQAGDIVVFCTDGLHDVISEEMMVRCVTAHNSPKDIAAALGDAVGNDKSFENVAAVVLQVVPIVP